ncbi:MAG: L-2-amino-thiazoline-4-carboxylic acid hydrolase [Tissierellia bacterium]|nr:L-2-amino-thiazoline-4-carboxylic acid hydrolase [Tissierellia bacterium]
MKLKKFYQKDLKEEELEQIDEKQKENYRILQRKLAQGQWNKKQKKYQKRSILPKLALYKTFRGFGYEKDEAKALTKKLQDRESLQANKLLRILFKIPKFKRPFVHIFKTTMEGDEVWETKVFRADDQEFRFDITKCTWKESCDFLGYPDMCTIFCDGDDVFFGGMDELRFRRCSTLAKGADQCDFKFVFPQREKR